MGISYSLVKASKPEAWQIGKDYLDFKSLFPPCASPMYAENSPSIVIRLLAKTAQYTIVGSTVFKLTDIYSTADEFKAAIVSRLQRNDVSYVDSLISMYDWAKDDEIQFIADFDELNDRDAADEYQLCDSPTKYIHVDSWNGPAGRNVGYEDFEEEEV